MSCRDMLRLNSVSEKPRALKRWARLSRKVARRSSALALPRSISIASSCASSLLMRRRNWRWRLGTSQAISWIRSKGSTQTLVVSRTRAAQTCSSLSMASSPTSSPGRWKPMTCSEPS